MADYAISTNLFTFAQVEDGFFAWPEDTGESEAIAGMVAGDYLVPKFSGQPEYLGTEESAAEQRQYVEQIGLDYSQILHNYNDVIRSGEGAVPYVLRVIGPNEPDPRSGSTWNGVKVEKQPLENPLSVQEFLRLRVVPEGLAAQFKGSVATGRHIQPLPDGAASAIRRIGADRDRGTALRQYTLIKAKDSSQTTQVLARMGRSSIVGDRVFIADESTLLGIHFVGEDGLLHSEGNPISSPPPREIENLFDRARKRRVKSDYFFPAPGRRGLNRIIELLNSSDEGLPIDNFQRFHDELVLLSRRVNQALEIAARSEPPELVPLVEDGGEDGGGPGHGDGDDPGEDVQFDELTRLDGLDIDSVRGKLPDGFELPDSVIAEAVTALRSGKHLLLSGPPGTGKSTFAVALCKAVVESQYQIATATADWTTFDTIGGYMPQDGGRLSFEPGIVLRALRQRQWLVIDEVNRADIDKAFGPLFTLLAGGDRNRPAPDITLPFRRNDRAIRIIWQDGGSPDASGDYVLTPGWRLLGTLNIKDKAALFELSFAFLRRFAVVDVPLPSLEGYRAWFRSRIDGIGEPAEEEIADAAMSLAFATRQLGPAILKDIANFIKVGQLETSSGQANYVDPVEAFLVAARLYAVPQYEGATGAEIKEATQAIAEVWNEPPRRSWEAFVAALDAVALA